MRHSRRTLSRQPLRRLDAAGSRGPQEAYGRQIIFYSVTTGGSERFACSRHQKPNGGGPLLRFRSHFPDIRVPRALAVSPFFFFFYRPTLSYDFGDPIDRPPSPGRRRRHRVSLGPRKGLNPRHSARGLDRSSHSVGDSRDDNRIPRARRRKEPARPDRTSLSRTRRTGCCIPEVILRSERRVSGRRARREEKESSGRQRRESEEKAP